MLSAYIKVRAASPPHRVYFSLRAQTPDCAQRVSHPVERVTCDVEWLLLFLNLAGSHVLEEECEGAQGREGTRRYA